MITIKHRFSCVTLCEFDVETMKEAAEKGKSNLRGANLYGANLDGANMEGANLRGADMEGANLRGANLYGANLDGANLRGANMKGEKLTKTPVVITGLSYWCMITDGFMRLGCKRFTHNEWANFTDEEISEMDDYALEFWKQWKIPLLAMCAAHRG